MACLGLVLAHFWARITGFEQGRSQNFKIYITEVDLIWGFEGTHILDG